MTPNKFELFSTAPLPIVQPPVTYSPPTIETQFTFIPETIRPPLPRRSTIRPAIGQSHIIENQELLSTEDRIKAILMTTRGDFH
jgi:hypothetical protein